MGNSDNQRVDGLYRDGGNGTYDRDGGDRKRGPAQQGDRLTVCSGGDGRGSEDDSAGPQVDTRNLGGAQGRFFSRFHKHGTAHSMNTLRWMVFVAIIIVTIMRTMIPVPAAQSMPAAPDTMVTRGPSTVAQSNEDWLKLMLTEQQRQESLAHAWLEWWPVIVVAAGLLVTYGMQKQWRFQIEKRAELYDEHVKDRDAHWTAREREALIRRVDEIHDGINSLRGIGDGK